MGSDPSLFEWSGRRIGAEPLEMLPCPHCTQPTPSSQTENSKEELRCFLDPRVRTEGWDGLLQGPFQEQIYLHTAHARLSGRPAMVVPMKGTWFSQFCPSKVSPPNCILAIYSFLQHNCSLGSCRTVQEAPNLKQYQRKEGMIGTGKTNTKFLGASQRH